MDPVVRRYVREANWQSVPADTPGAPHIASMPRTETQSRMLIKPASDQYYSEARFSRAIEINIVSGSGLIEVDNAELDWYTPGDTFALCARQLFAFRFMQSPTIIMVTWDTPYAPSEN